LAVVVDNRDFYKFQDLPMGILVSQYFLNLHQDYQNLGIGMVVLIKRF